jgi:hypothetical protein
LCVHVFNSSTLAYATLCAFSAIFHPKELWTNVKVENRCYREH